MNAMATISTLKSITPLLRDSHFLATQRAVVFSAA